MSTTNRSNERGQILVMFGGGLIALLIIAALAFDVGMMLVERRDEQNAADAAALAGARYLPTLGMDVVAAEAAARSIALQNGFEDSDPNEVVNVYIPPLHGEYAGYSGFIEVQIEGTRPSVFGGIIDRATWPIGVMAVATNAQNLTFPFSMLALNPTECRAISVTGGGIVEAYANIQSNSSGEDCVGDPDGFARTGGSTIHVIAPDATCRVVGDLKDEGSGDMTCTVAENSFALPDPLRNLPEPTQPPLAAGMVYAGTDIPAPTPPKNCPGGTPAPNAASPVTCKIPASGGPANVPWILYPGLYPGGLEIDADRTVYLMPGIYWIGGGGIDVGGGGSIVTIATEADAAPNVADATWGGGVLIYNSKLPAKAAGPIVLNSNSAMMKLKPLDVPDTDPDAIYNDIVIFQDRTVTEAVTLNGSASTTEVMGIIYVPAAQVKLNGSGGTLIVDQIIADTFDISGSSGTIKILHGTGVDAVIIAAGLVE